MKIKVLAVGQYKGCNLNEVKSVNLSFKFKYDQLTQAIRLTQMLNNDVMVAVKIPDMKALKLGMFRIKNITIDDDGESVVKFNGMSDFIEMDNLNKIITKEFFQIRFESDIESEEADENGK